MIKFQRLGGIAIDMNNRQVYGVVDGKSERYEYDMIVEEWKDNAAISKMIDNIQGKKFKRWSC